MKTTEEIFNWLVRNCHYFRDYKLPEDIERILAENKEDGGITLSVAINYIPAFHADLKAFEAFVGEKYSFRKHILPLIEAGLICCTRTSKEFATARYAGQNDAVEGLVKNYDTNQEFVCFWLGNSDPNKD